jgi:hypothetical protein
MIGKTISHSPREIIKGSYLCKKYNLIPLSHGVKITGKLLIPSEQVPIAPGHVGEYTGRLT